MTTKEIKKLKEIESSYGRSIKRIKPALSSSTGMMKGILKNMLIRITECKKETSQDIKEAIHEKLTR